MYPSGQLNLPNILTIHSEYLYHYRQHYLPLNQDFVQLARKQMLIFGIWPLKYLEGIDNKLYLAHSWFVAIAYHIMFLLQLLYVKTHSSASIYEIGHMMILVTMSFAVQTRLFGQLLKMKPYGNLFKQFFESLHLSNYPHHDEKSLKILHNCEKSAKFLFIAFAGLTGVGVVVFNVAPIILNFRSGAYESRGEIALETSLAFSLPFDYKHNLFNWAIVASMHAVVSYTVIGVIISQDCFLFYFILHILGHMEIMKEDFMSMLQKYKKGEKDNSQEVGVEVLFVSQAENNEVYDKLKRCVEHHIELINFVVLIQDVYGLTLLSNYVFDVAGSCILLFELTQLTIESLLRYSLFLIGTFGQLYVNSVFIDQLVSKSDELREVAYAIPWELLGRRSRFALRMFLLRAEQPLRLTAFGVADVSVATMTQIIKTSFSYFTMLQTLE